jgi:hypothetical protein
VLVVQDLLMLLFLLDLIVSLILLLLLAEDTADIMIQVLDTDLQNLEVLEVVLGPVKTYLLLETVNNMVPCHHYFQHQHQGRDILVDLGFLALETILAAAVVVAQVAQVEVLLLDQMLLERGELV